MNIDVVHAAEPLEQLSLDALEPFGWIWTPGPRLPASVPLDTVLDALGITASEFDRTNGTAEFGAYTEKGRYRVETDGRRVTLYSERPAWLVSQTVGAENSGSGLSPTSVGHRRHTVFDGLTGRPLVRFLRIPAPGYVRPLDLFEPLDAPAINVGEAIIAAQAGEERILSGLPVQAEYGARHRLIPGFVQVTDVWRITFDTSALSLSSSDGEREVAWVVIVDDKAGHRWLSAAVKAP